MRESEIEDYLVKRVKELGGEVRKMRWIGHRGAPDRFVMVCGINFFVELKAPGKKPVGQQEKEIATMRRLGVSVFVADTKEQVDYLLDLCSSLLKPNA